MLGGGHDSMYVVTKAEAGYQFWKLRHVVAHDDAAPAFRCRQAKSLDAVGIHLPTREVEEAPPEPCCQDRSRIRSDADPRHGFGDQGENRLPPRVRVTNPVMHLVPLMPREPV